MAGRMVSAHLLLDGRRAVNCRADLADGPAGARPGRQPIISRESLAGAARRLPL